MKSRSIVHRRGSGILPLIAGLVLTWSLFGAIDLHAQPGQDWQLIGGLPFSPGMGGTIDYGQIDCIFFYDTLHGVVSFWNTVQQITDTEQIWYTSNKTTWKKAVMPSGIVTINAIRLINGKLYAAVSGPDLLVSVDSGATWNYAGLGLRNADDVYSDASGTIRTLSKALPNAALYGSFARVDQLHCLWTDIEHQVRISNDGGATWTNTGLSSSMFGCYGDTCGKIFMFNDSSGIYRSSDFGQTWQKNSFGYGYIPEYLEGASGVIYISRGAAKQLSTTSRSTDNGATWTTFAYPFTAGNNIASMHFAVFGPMGNDIVIPWGNRLYLMTTGGDGTLHSPLSSDWSNATVHIAASCPIDSIAIPFVGTVDSMTTTISVLSDSLNEFRLLGPSVIHLFSGKNAGAYINYHPRSNPGSSTLQLLFHHSWHCSDWTETRTVIVTSSPSVQLIAPGALRGSCDLVQDTGFLRIDSCQVLVIDSIRGNGSRLNYARALPDSIHLGYHDSIFFVFDPRDTTCRFTSNVEIVGHYLGTNVPFDQTIKISLLAQPQPPALLSTEKTLDFPSVMLCRQVQPRDTSVLFVNTGCTSDTLTNVTVLGGGFSWLRDSLPIVIASGDSVRLRFRFEPPDSGSFSGTAALTVISMGLSQTPQLGFSGAGVRGSGVLSLQSTPLQAGSFSFCAGDTTITDTLRNTGCDTLFLHGAMLAGDKAFALLNQLPQYLLPQDSVVVQIQFAPRRKGPHAASLTISTKDSSFSIPVSGVGLPGTKYIAADQSLRDFGSLYICESRDTTITLTNPGCDTLTLLGDSIAGGNRSYRTDMTYPIMIVPGGSVKVQVHLSPDTTGQPVSFASTLIFKSNSDTGTVKIPMMASIIKPAHLTLSLGSDVLCTSTAGQTVTFPVVLTEDVRSTSLQGIHFDLTHNDDLLGYMSGLVPAKTSGPSTAQVQHFDLSPIPNGDTIGSLTFRVYLADSIATSLALSNIIFDNTLGLAPDCIASVSDSGSAFTYIAACGDGLMRDYMTTGSFSIVSVQPNPAREEFTVSFTKPEGVPIQYEIMDALGRAMASGETDQNALTLSASNLPSGVLLLRASANGFVRTQRFVVAK